MHGISHFCNKICVVCITSHSRRKWSDIFTLGVRVQCIHVLGRGGGGGKH